MYITYIFASYFESVGGVWTAQLQPVGLTGNINAYFSFFVDPCFAQNPNGIISLVFQAERCLILLFYFFAIP
jgi:hypothetical protein